MDSSANTSTPYRCFKPRRFRNRRFQNVNILVRSLTQINDIVHDRSLDLKDSVQKLRTAKRHLENCIDEVRELEMDLLEKTDEFKEVTDELRQAIDDMKTPDLYAFEEVQQTILSVHVNLAEQDTIAAYKEINDIYREVDTESPIVHAPGPKSRTKCYDKVIIPKMRPQGAISLIASVNESPKCTICLDRKSDCVLYECGHICVCFGCAIVLIDGDEFRRKCPVCRSYIKEVIKTSSS